MVENEKTKLKILMQSKEKKIEQKDREMGELKQKIEEKDRLLTEANQVEKGTERSDDAPRISQYRKEKKYKKPEKPAFLTHVEQESGSNTISLFDRFELSNKDGPWREKCEQLYLENKKLQGELDKYQTSLSSIPNTPKREGFSLNLRQRR